MTEQRADEDECDDYDFITRVFQLVVCLITIFVMLYGLSKLRNVVTLV